MLDGDPALNAWALNWVSHAMTHDPWNLLNGNTFYPHRGSIAFSEHMASLAVFNIGVRWFTDNPWVGYNLLIFAAYLVSAIGGFALIHYLTASRAAALWGGVFWGFCFFRVHHTGHLQILSYQWLPFIVLYLLKLRREPTSKNVALLAMCFILQALTSWYLAVIATFLCAIVFPFNIHRAAWTRRHTIAFACVAGIAAAVILPFAISYSHAVNGTTMQDRFAGADMLHDMVKIRDFLTPPSATFLGSLIADNKYWVWGENTLFIGYSACILALLGIWNFVRRCQDPVNQRLSATALCLIVLGYVFARGYTSSHGQMYLPLYYVAWIFPYVAAIRATQRFALLVYFGSLILSAQAVAQFPAKRRSLVGGIAVAMFLFEVYPWQSPFGPSRDYAPSAPDRAISELQKNRSSPLVVLHLPIYTAMPGYPVREATYMVDSTLHWANILNGFSGIEPQGFREDMSTLNLLPDPRAIEILKNYRVDVLAIHGSLAAERRAEIKTFFEDSGIGSIRPVDQEQFLVVLPQYSKKNLIDSNALRP